MQDYKQNDPRLCYPHSNTTTCFDPIMFYTGLLLKSATIMLFNCRYLI